MSDMELITKHTHPERYGSGKDSLTSKIRKAWIRRKAKLYAKTGWGIFRYPKKQR